MHVRVLEAGHDEGALQVDDLGGGPPQTGHLFVGTRGEDAIATEGERRNALRLRAGKRLARQHVAVQEDAVRRRALGRQR